MAQLCAGDVRAEPHGPDGLGLRHGGGDHWTLLCRGLPWQEQDNLHATHHRRCSLLGDLFRHPVQLHQVLRAERRSERNVRGSIRSLCTRVTHGNPQISNLKSFGDIYIVNWSWTKVDNWFMEIDHIQANSSTERRTLFHRLFSVGHPDGDGVCAFFRPVDFQRNHCLHDTKILQAP